MAEVISDFVSDSSRFHHGHTMVGGSGSGSQLSPPETQYRPRSRNNPPPPSPRHQPTTLPAGTPPRSAVTRATAQPPAENIGERTASVRTEPPSPPPSSSPNPPHDGPRFSSQRDYVQAQYEHSPPGSNVQTAVNPTSASQASITRSARSLDNITQYGSNTIKVRDLAHIQSFATEEFLSYRGQSGRRRTADDPTLKYEISGMPITDIIEMVAGLLTKITNTNDRQHENLQRPIPTSENTINMTGLSSSVLAFHGKNVPSITILSYLSRIHKYCPTTYEVFLSLLVYFDRMTERVNASPMQALNKENADQDDSRPSSGYSAEGSDLADSPPPSSRSVPELQSDLERAQYTHAPHADHSSSVLPLSHFFVVDSFNIHRLVIAGVTCASKFFSDVFYTNSRYAKVIYISRCCRIVLTILGWRAATCRIESSRIAISPLERFPPLCPCGRTRSVWDDVG